MHYAEPVERPYPLPPGVGSRMLMGLLRIGKISGRVQMYDDCYLTAKKAASKLRANCCSSGGGLI